MEQEVKVVRKLTEPTDLGDLRLIDRKCPTCGGRFKTLEGSDQVYDNVLCLVQGEFKDGEQFFDPVTGAFRRPTRRKGGRPRKIVWDSEKE